MNGERVRKTGLVVVGGVLIAGLSILCNQAVAPLVWRNVHYNTAPLMREILAAAAHLPALAIALGIGWILFRWMGAGLSRRAVVLWVSAPWLAVVGWGVTQAFVSGQADAAALASAGFWSSLLCVPLGLLVAGHFAAQSTRTAAAAPPSDADSIAFGAVPKLFLLGIIVLVSLLAGSYVEGWLAYHALPRMLIFDYYLTGFLAFSGGAMVMAAVSTYPLVAVFGARAKQAGWAVPGVLLAMRLYNLAFAGIGRTPQELMFNAYEAIAAAGLIYFATSMRARGRAPA